VQAFDRYAGMNNNPVRFNDPTGHDVGCPGMDASKCGVGSKWNFNTAGNVSWKKKLLALVVAAESANGSYPSGAMILTAHTLLNRLANGQWDRYEIPIWEAVNDTAISKLMDYYPGPVSFKDEGWTSVQELQTWVSETWASVTNGKFSGGYSDALKAVEKAAILPSKKFIYFSHQTDPVDHSSVSERHQWILETAALRTNEDQSFEFQHYGPYYSKAQGFQILLIASNDEVCGTSGSCGPPWPSNTP
jgi:hypothetical protein